MPTFAALRRRGLALVKTHPRKSAAAVAALTAMIAGGALLLTNDDPVHLPRPRGVRPIVLSITEDVLPPGAPRPSLSAYDPAFAGAPSAALELVRSAKGKLAKPFRVARDCSHRPCVKRILLKADGVRIDQYEVRRVPPPYN